jgi:diphosphomevalonate decarboxylase
MGTATARAHANIALVKYWGKRDAALNLPAVGSISATLGELYSETTVELVGDARDQFELDGRQDVAQSARVSAFMTLFRQTTGVVGGARVSSRNSFPTAAGLASSASGFAALAVAAYGAAGIEPSVAALSVLARRGSGSAPRSLFGGYVEMVAGTRADGMDAVAEPLAGAMHWPLDVVIAVTSEARKTVGSTAGMSASRDSSPFFEAFVDNQAADLDAARAAVRDRDFERLAEVAEASALKLHAVAMTTAPGLLYWNGATVEAIHAVRALRAGGTPAFFTIDAGPQVKVFCERDSADQVEASIAALPSVRRVIRTALGPAARLLEASP